MGVGRGSVVVEVVRGDINKPQLPTVLAVNHQLTERAGPRPAARGVGTAGRRNFKQEKSLFQTRLLKLLSSFTV